MSSTYKLPVALFPVLNNDQAYGASFAPISIGIGNWGSRNPQWNPPTATYSTSPIGRIAKVHALGKMWMQPVSVQDSRMREGIYDEAANTLNLRDTDFGQLVGEVIRALPQNAVPYCTVAQSLPTVNCDPELLRQVFANLIGNAVKFTLEGEIGIRAQTFEGPNGQRLRFDLIDGSPARAPDDEPRIDEGLPISVDYLVEQHVNGLPR